MLTVLGDDTGKLWGGAGKDLDHMGLAMEVALHQMLRRFEIRAGCTPGEH